MKTYMQRLFKKSNKIDAKLERSLKMSFKIMFDGVGDYVDSDFNCSLLSLGITNVKFKDLKSNIEMTITLERPGLLIGKAGRTIDRVQKHLSNVAERNVKIEIIESKLWR